MTSRLFYATHNDICKFLDAVESRRALKYTLSELRSTPTSPAYQSATDLPSLGIAGGESSSACTRYLVSAPETSIEPYGPNSSGSFFFSQMGNPQTIMLTAGGWWRETVLIPGSFGTAYTKDPSSSLLMKVFTSALKKTMIRFNSIYLGREAEKHWRQGARLTYAAQSPPEFDLQVPKE